MSITPGWRGGSREWSRDTREWWLVDHALIALTLIIIVKWLF